MKKIILTLTLLMCIAIQFAFAQSERKLSMIQSYSLPTDAPGWYKFSAGFRENPNNVLNDNKSFFELTGNDEMTFVRTKSDKLGMTHLRFQQFYKFVKVEGAEMIVHVNGSDIYCINGHVAKKLSMNVVPTISSLQSISIAKGKFDNVVFLADDIELTGRIKSNILYKEADINYHPELVLCRTDWNKIPEQAEFILAWKVQMVVFPMQQSCELYLDAATGSVIHSEPLNSDCDPGSGATTWYGDKNFTTSWYSWPENNWHLDYDEGGCGNRTNISSRRGDDAIPYNYGDGDNQWYDANGANGYNQKAGVTTYWGLINAYDYYYFTFSRPSFDGSNSGLDAFSEVAGGIWMDAENASWSNIFHTLHFGGGADATTPIDDWNCQDVIGHELTHGVTQYSAGLDYSYESGALNESFSDIFGEMIEFYTFAGMDWLCSADKSTGAIRSFITPNSFQQPDTYLGDWWYSGSDDNGGVHYNSGVQNYWFYLLSNGGSGTNELGDVYQVTAQGALVASDIAYRDLDTYMISSSNFIDSRSGSIQAAFDLYGSCSIQGLQTARAWWAVGVGYVCPANNYVVPCGNIPAGASTLIYDGITSVSAGSGCATTVLSSSAPTVFSSTGSVTLFPGFTAQSGCTFTSKIDPCSIAAYKTELDESEDAELQPEVTISDDILVYPNPVESQLTVSSNQLTGNAITIYDVLGRIVFSKIAVQNYEIINLKSFPSGPYFVTVKTENKIITEKVIKLSSE